MPYALFRYDPEEEFELRRQVTMLQIRLEQAGKRVLRISLAECLEEAMASVQPLADWFEAERTHGIATVVDTIQAVLAEYRPLVELVAKRMPDDPDPMQDVVLISARARCSLSIAPSRCWSSSGPRIRSDRALLSRNARWRGRPPLHGSA